MTIQTKQWVIEMILATVFFSNLWHQCWYTKEGICNGWSGSTIHLKNMSGLKCSLALSQLLKPFWAAGSSFYSFTNCKQLQHNRCLLESFSAQLIASCTWTGRIHHLLGSLISKPQHFFSFHCVLPSSTPALKSSYSSFHILHPSPLILKGMIPCPLL